jgi:hypothetical protein
MMSISTTGGESRSTAITDQTATKKLLLGTKIQVNYLKEEILVRDALSKDENAVRLEYDTKETELLGVVLQMIRVLKSALDILHDSDASDEKKNSWLDR